MSVTSPPCPECQTVTEPIKAEDEDVFRCPAPGCGRRTYGTGDPDADDALPPYTETDADGAVFVHHGTGEVDIEATAELTAQDGPAEDDQADEEQAAPAADTPHPASTPGVGHVPGAPGRGISPTGWGRRPGTERAPGTTVTLRAITDSDGGAGVAPQRPQPGVGHGPAPQRPPASPRGHR